MRYKSLFITWMQAVVKQIVVSVDMHGAALSLHQRQIFLENDPHFAIGRQLLADDLFHVDCAPVLKSHALGQTRILSVEVLVAMECDIGQPANLLSTCTAEDLEVLITHMDSNTKRFHLLHLAVAHVTQSRIGLTLYHLLFSN